MQSSLKVPWQQEGTAEIPFQEFYTFWPMQRSCKKSRREKVEFSCPTFYFNTYLKGKHKGNALHNRTFEKNLSAVPKAYFKEKQSNMQSTFNALSKTSQVWQKTLTAPSIKVAIHVKIWQCKIHDYIESACSRKYFFLKYFPYLNNTTKPHSWKW